MKNLGWISKKWFKKFFWKGKTQFWDVCWKRFAREVNNICSMYKKDLKVLFKLKLLFAQKIPQDTIIAFLTTPLIKFRRNGGKISMKIRNWSRKISSDIRFSKRSFGHFECRFENFVEKFLTKRRKTDVEYPQKVNKNFFPKEPKTFKILVSRRWTRFWKTAEKFSTKGRTFLLNNWKRSGKFLTIWRKGTQKLLLDT